MRCGIYARVSTDDKGQDLENQLVELRRFAAARGWTSVEYLDQDSGSHSRRPALLQLFEDASRRKLDIVLVWALDRLTREGVAQTFEHIKRLKSYGVEFESFTEAHFRTTGPAGELMIAIAAWIAEQERRRISERTKAGLARVKAQGKRLGRPERIFRRDVAVAMREAGWSFGLIAKELKVPKATVARVLAGVSKTPLFHGDSERQLGQ